MNKTDRPDFLYFDLGNVLVDFDHQRAVRQLADASGCASAVFQAALLESEWPHDYERGKLSTAEFCSRLRQETGSDIADDRICLAISDIFQLNRPIVPLLGSLRLSGIPMGLLSNTCDAHWEFLKARPCGVLDLFAIQALSFRLGMIKPEPAIYAEATRLAGVPAEKIFFTDDLEPNVEAARQAGWDAIQFINVEQLVHELRQRGLRFNY